MSLGVNDLEEIEAANRSGRPTVAFIHGLWLLSSSWDRWRRMFEQRGFATVAPGWPDDPATVAEARAHPEVFAGKRINHVTEHYLDALSRLTRAPAVVGHSFGGLIAQKVAGEGASATTVAIDPAPFRGVLPLPLAALRSSFAVLRSPANRRRAVTLTETQFAFGWANALDEDEAARLYAQFHVAASGAPIFQAATANVSPWTEAKVDTRNPDRGPLLIIGGERDHTVPLAITRAMNRRQRRNSGDITEYVEVPDRGHALTIDDRWQEVAAIALEFITRTHRVRPPEASGPRPV